MMKAKGIPYTWTCKKPNKLLSFSKTKKMDWGIQLGCRRRDHNSLFMEQLHSFCIRLQTEQSVVVEIMMQPAS